MQNSIMRERIESAQNTTQLDGYLFALLANALILTSPLLFEA